MMNKLTRANIATARAVLLTAAIAAVPLVPMASFVSFRMSGGGPDASALAEIGMWILVVAFYVVASIGGVWAVFGALWCIFEGFGFIRDQWSHSAKAIDEL